MLSLYRTIVKSLLALMALAVIFTAYHAYGKWERYSEVKAHYDNATSHVKVLEEEIEALENELDRLKHDPSYYEQLAREEFGMVRPDETVYIVELP